MMRDEGGLTMIVSGTGYILSVRRRLFSVLLCHPKHVFSRLLLCVRGL